MNTPGTPVIDDQIRILVAADGPAAERLAAILSSAYARVVAITDLDGDIVGAAGELDVDVLVLGGGSSMHRARKIAEAIAASASRVTVMIVDDPDTAEDTLVFWPKERTYRIAGASEPLPLPTPGVLA